MPATTQDHLPPRSVFDNKKWPEGYVFPACLKCNGDFSKHDSVFALVSRIKPGVEETEAVFQETKKLIDAYIEKYPDEASKVFLSANQKRSWARKAKLELAQGESYSELPVINMPKTWTESIELVSKKLIKALHYKHTGKIIPSSAEIKITWWTNTALIDGSFPLEFLEIIPQNVLIKRDNVTLNNQFSYGYQTSEDGLLGIYGMYFRFSFYVAGIVSFDASVLNYNNNAKEISV